MNIKKTQVMFLGRRNRRKEVEHALLVHQGVTLTAKPKVKFLGVIVDKDLNWSEHVASIRRKCLVSMVQLRQIFPWQSLEEQLRVLLYNVLIEEVNWCHGDTKEKTSFPGSPPCAERAWKQA